VIFLVLAFAGTTFVTLGADNTLLLAGVMEKFY
jgi:hypothetical protein